MIHIYNCYIKKSTITRDTYLFDFRQTDPAPVLLIVDRREDPVTPLLNQVNKNLNSVNLENFKT